jgi:hypothetical protein
MNKSDQKRKSALSFIRYELPTRGFKKPVKATFFGSILFMLLSIPIFWSYHFVPPQEYLFATFGMAILIIAYMPFLFISFKMGWFEKNMRYVALGIAQLYFAVFSALLFYMYVDWLNTNGLVSVTFAVLIFVALAVVLLRLIIVWLLIRGGKYRGKPPSRIAMFAASMAPLLGLCIYCFMRLLNDKNIVALIFVIGVPLFIAIFAFGFVHFMKYYYIIKYHFTLREIDAELPSALLEPKANKLGL